ncbi:lipoyl(octanoyl) transferase [Filomicrobium insigne]|uniref:Octanoyltransferase n=1 Tax=Filomicrobium insigne TaxID=418854 RepID=A0A1H0UID3_9HYPH|nr:lipoyl(octanoyl) transferase LipB [Filomicrobium insigne]SDP65939.1 lipoyl(octanoyl) transferase [Filomicrobium insigne]
MPITQISDKEPIPAIEWAVSSAPIDYPRAVAFMEQRAAEIRAGTARELIWLCEHPPLYTAGTSAQPQDLLEPARFPVHTTGRGGQYTYHGPGQRVVYVMLDVRRHFGDVRSFVTFLETWTIDTLDSFGVKGETRKDRVGVWVKRPDKGDNVEDKIAAIGVRLRRWVSFHGLAINVNPDLTHFSGIVPCGIREHGVTSISDLNVNASMADVDAALRTKFQARFHSVRETADPFANSVSRETGAALAAT